MLSVTWNLMKCDIDFTTGVSPNALSLIFFFARMTGESRGRIQCTCEVEFTWAVNTLGTLLIFVAHILIP